MLRTNSRNTLAIELAKTSNRSSGEIERALAAFIDPANTAMTLENFMSTLLDIAAGDGTGALTDDDNTVKNILSDVIVELKSARLFNNTYLGHMLSESSIPGMLGYMLAIRVGSNTVAREVSLRESELEPEAIRSLLEIIGFDPMAGSGTFTSGGTLANMTALAVARSRLMKKYSGENIKKVKVLASPLAHYSVAKACYLLGGPSQQIEMVKVLSDGFRLSVDDLIAKIIEAEEKNVPIMSILAIAGETETGLVDPLNEIAGIAEEYDIPWIADGAYGAPYRLSRVGGKLDGIKRAFAVTLDPHKALYTPYSNGAVLFRNVEDHARWSHEMEQADYLQFSHDLPTLIDEIRTGTGQLGQKRIEGSMGAGSILSTVAVMRTLGRDGLGTVYDLTLDRIDHLYEKITQSRYLVPLFEPELNLLCFTLKDDARKRIGISDSTALEQFINKTRKQLDNDFRGPGGYYFSTTALPLDEGEKLWVWRACIMNPRTTNAILDAAVDGLEQLIQAAIK